MAESGGIGDLWLRIKSAFDSQGTNEAEKGLKGVKTEGDATNETFKELGYSADALKASMLELVAFAEVVAIFHEGVTEAVNLERSFRGINFTTQQLGQDQKKTNEEIEKFAGALQRVSGVATSETIEALRKTYVQTHDLEQAMTRVSLASDIFSRGGAKTLTEALGFVEAAADGNARAFKELYGERLKGDDQLDTSEKMLARLEKDFRGATVEVNDHARKVEQATGAWKNFVEEVGQKVLPILTNIKDAIGTAGSRLLNLAEAEAAALKYLFNRTHENYEALQKAGRKYFEDGKALVAEDVETIRKAAAEKVKVNEELQKRIEAERKAAQEKADAEAAAKAAAEAAKNRSVAIAEEKKLSTESLAIYRALQQSKVAAADGYAAKYHAEMELLAREEALALGKLINDHANTEINRANISETYANKRLAIEIKLKDDIKKLDQTERDEFYKWEQNTLKVATENVHKMVGVWLEGYRLKQQARERDLKAEKEISAAVTGLGDEAFGQSKAWAIAKAEINEAQSITSIWAEWGAYPVVAAVLTALSVATNIAQIAKIESAEPGSGFDDPRNDQAAYLGGRRWANDMIGKFTSGVSAGWAGAMVGGNPSTTNNNNNARTFNINWNGAGTVDPNNVESMKKLIRAFKTMEKQYDTVRRVSRSGQ